MTGILKKSVLLLCAIMCCFLWIELMPRYFYVILRGTDKVLHYIAPLRYLDCEFSVHYLLSIKNMPFFPRIIVGLELVEERVTFDQTLILINLCPFLLLSILSMQALTFRWIVKLFTGIGIHVFYHFLTVPFLLFIHQWKSVAHSFLLQEIFTLTTLILPIFIWSMLFGKREWFIKVFHKPLN